MKYAKLITAGVLVLTVAALNDLQETVYLRAERFVQMRLESTGLNPVAVLLEDQSDSTACCKEVPGYPKTRVSNTRPGESVLSDLNKWCYRALSRIDFMHLYETYSLIARLVLSRPVLPVAGS